MSHVSFLITLYTCLTTDNPVHMSHVTFQIILYTCLISDNPVHMSLVTFLINLYTCLISDNPVHSVQQKSISVIFHTSRSGSDVRYSCHHNLSRFSFTIFVHSWRFSVFHSLQSITPYILTDDNNTFA